MDRLKIIILREHGKFKSQERTIYVWKSWLVNFKYSYELSPISQLHDSAHLFREQNRILNSIGITISQRFLQGFEKSRVERLERVWFQKIVSKALKSRWEKNNAW